MESIGWLPLTAAQALQSSVAERVWAVGELVEQVLVHLPAADLVRCRRVNQKFLQTVTCSKLLRQKLFLEPDMQSERAVNPLAPRWFHQERVGYRDDTIAARINLWEMWTDYSDSVSNNKEKEEVRRRRPPFWGAMLISQPPTTSCVIPAGDQRTIFFRHYSAKGITFGELERAIIAAFEIRQGRRSSRERLEELSIGNSVLIYWR